MLVFNNNNNNNRRSWPWLDLSRPSMVTADRPSRTVSWRWRLQCEAL